MVTFSVIGDMGSGETLQYKVSKSLNNIIKNNNSKFVCGLGDNIYDNGCNSVDDKQFIDKFEKPYKHIPDSIKFYMCLGNHDYGQFLKLFNIDNSNIQLLYSELSKKNNKKWVMPDKYYTFEKGNIKFYVLDTNFDRMTKYQINKQLKYIKDEIKKSKSKWNILYGHHTYRSVGGHGNADDDLETFLNSIFRMDKIDLYMCGHDHSKQLIIEKLPKNKYVHLLVCGTGGYGIDDYYNEDNLDENKSELLFYSKTPGTALISSTNTKLDITFYNLSKPEFNYSIIKK